MSNTDFFKKINNNIKSIGDDLFDFIKERDNWIYDSKQRSIYSNRYQTFSITYCFYDDRKEIIKLNKKFKEIKEKFDKFIKERELDLKVYTSHDVVINLIKTYLETKFESLYFFWPDHLPFPNSQCRNYIGEENNPWCIIINNLEWFQSGVWNKFSHTEDRQSGEPEDMERGQILWMNGELIQSTQKFIYPDKDIVKYSNSEEHFKNKLLDSIQTFKKSMKK